MRASEATRLPTPQAVQLLAKIDVVATGVSGIAICAWGHIGKICDLRPPSRYALRRDNLRVACQP